MTIELGDICLVKGRIGWRGYTRNDLRDSGPLVLGAAQISAQNKLDLSKPIYISQEKYLESPEIMINKGDVLIVKVGNTIGKVAIVNKDIGEATLNPNCVVLKNLSFNIVQIIFHPSENFNFFPSCAVLRLYFTSCSSIVNPFNTNLAMVSASMLKPWL